ncbi:MAG: DUF1415 family protein, partial [Polyangiales bacterium]
MTRTAKAEAARHAYGRYFDEVVVAHHLCPWARGAAEAGAVAVEVAMQTSLPATLARLQAWLDAPQVAVAILIFAGTDLNRADFERFVESVRTAQLDTSRAAPARAGHDHFLLAAFHPEPLGRDARTLSAIDLIRCSPDPTLQAVRASVLASVRPAEDGDTRYVEADKLASWDAPARAVPLHERVARANAATLARLGQAQLAAQLR